MNHLSIAEEEALFAELRRQREGRRLARERATPEQARLVADLKANYPHLSAGVIVPLAEAGIAPGTPPAQAAAQAGVKARAKRGLGWHSVGDVVRGGVRGLTTALAAPAEEVDRQVRDIASTVREEGWVKGLLFGGGVAPPGEPAQTSAGIAVERLERGERVDLGSGYFPAGEIRTEQARRARTYGTIDGKGITLGRLTASVVTEPGTKPHSFLSGLVDLSVELGADPAALGLKSAGAARAAAKTFSGGAGLVRGPRKTVLPDVADAWLSSNQGRKVTEWLAETPSPDTIWRRTNKKLDPALVVRLADEDDPGRVAEILRGEILAGHVREKPVIARPKLENVRLLQKLPGPHFDFFDPAQLVEQIDRFARNARLPEEVIASHVEEAMRATNASRRLEVTKAVMGTVEEVLAHHGVKRPQARAMTRLIGDDLRELRRYAVSEIGENMAIPGVVLDGVGRPLPSPHLVVEAIGRTLPVPDVRDIRRATSRFAKIWEVPGVEGSVAVLDFLANDVWKAFALLRFAWPVRVIGEEQVRMATAGLDNVFSHPLSMISRLMAGRGKTGITGEALADSVEARKALTRGAAGWVGSARTIVVKGKTTYAKGHEHYADSLADEIATLASDPVAREVAKDVNAARAWFWDGPGQKLRREQVPFAGGVGIDDPADAHRYIDSLLERIQTKTGNDPRLVEAIATGKLEGLPVLDQSGGTTTMGRDFIRRIGELVDTENVGPAVVRGDVRVGGQRLGAEVVERYNRVVDSAFGWLMSKRTNYLSRSPAFEQFYWRRTTELMGSMTDEARQATLAQAKAAKLGRDELRALEQAAKAPTTGLIGLEEADLIAKGYGLDHTKRLLFDLSEKAAWADAGRLIFPFASAFQELGTTWTRLAVEQPQVIRRVHQGVEGARGAGWFTTDPTTGDEVFQYPGSEFLTKGLLGVPVPMRGRVQSLNLFSSGVPFVPGVGPVVQFSVGKLIPDKPDWDWVREVIYPVGEPETGGGVLEAMFPAWAQKVRRAIADPESDRLFGNAVGDVAAYLSSTGQYDLSQVEEQERLTRDATAKARAIFVLRALGQLTLPAAPSPEFLARDRDGRIVTAHALREEFRKLQNDDYEGAVETFLDRHGLDSLLYMQPKTRGGFSPTDALHDFVRDNPEVARRYPHVYGFFAPTGGEWSFPEYDRQLATGEREALGPEDAVKLANHRVAAMIYRTARDKVGTRPTAEQRAWLGELRDALVTDYPGYEPGTRDATKTRRQIEELARALEVPKLARTDAGQAVATYMQAREKAKAAAQELGLAPDSFATAKGARHLRDWLRDLAGALSEEHPDFAPVWDRLLERELADDLDTEQEAA